MAISDGAALNRWRLVLGNQAEGEMPLPDPRLRRMDDALDFLYGREAGNDVRQGGQGASSYIDKVMVSVGDPYLTAVVERYGERITIDIPLTWEETL